jgi:hypothetical protein
MCQEEGSTFVSTPKKQSLPLNLVCPKYLNVRSLTCLPYNKNVVIKLKGVKSFSLEIFKKQNFPMFF